MSQIDMNSDAWQSLPDDERWSAIREVALRFSKQFGHLPQIQYIDNSPYSIEIGTSLSHGELIAELPTNFQGIPVKQEGLREVIDGFIATWKLVLARIGGWPAEKIQAWLDPPHSILRSSWILHQPPLY